MKLFKVIRTTACGVKFATRVGITVGSNMLQGVANVADVAGRAAKKRGALNITRRMVW